MLLDERSTTITTNHPNLMGAARPQLPPNAILSPRATRDQPVTAGGRGEGETR